LNTPWGASGSWQARTLISSFHRNTDDGQQFFDILERLRKDPARFLPVIELMYLCLSLGFIGPYRPPRGDSARFDHIRNEVCTLIIHERRIADVPLSPQWKGIPARYRAHRRLVPVWVAIATAVAATGGLFAAVSAELNAGSDTIYARMLAAPPARMPSFQRVSRVQPPPAPIQTVGSTVIDRLKNALQAGIVSGHLTVLGTPSAPVVRIGNQGMFPAGSASPQATSIGLLEALGSTLKAEQGTLQVIGYTDNQPIRTVQFPSNFQLSLARAQAVRAVIIHTLGDATRVTAEGRADADPIASNATAEGRELNRRIEIVLHRQDQQE
jgi:type VI secretion system protein ImpK